MDDTAQTPRIPSPTGRPTRRVWFYIDVFSGAFLLLAAIATWRDHRISAFLFFGATLAGKNVHRELCRR